MKTEYSKANQEIEKLRQTIATTDFMLDASKMEVCFCNPFFSSMAFFESTEALGDTELVDSIMTIFLKTLEKIGDKCRMNMINSVLQPPDKKDAKQMLNQLTRGDKIMKALVGREDRLGKSEVQAILLQVPGTDFVHCYLGNKEISSVIHYFAKENIGIINTSFQGEEMYTSRFSIPNAQG